MSLDTNFTRRQCESLLDGIELDDGPVQFNQIDIIDKKHIAVTITEGRNHIVRRSLKHVGNEVVKLHRVMIGNIQLAKINPGHFKPLSKKEITELQNMLKYII